jgi:predicted ATPase
MDTAARMFRHHDRVFIAPPWLEIFARDTERKQSFEQAQATCEVMGRNLHGARQAHTA